MSSDYIEFKHTFPKLLPYYLANIYLLQYVYALTEVFGPNIYVSIDEKISTMNVMWFSFPHLKSKAS